MIHPFALPCAVCLRRVRLPSESFETATDFLKRAESGITGCLVLDVRMPGPSGLDLQRALNAAGQDIPIIFVTAHADVPLTVRAMKAGALEVLTKPFDDQALLDAVYQALEKERVRRHDRQEFHKLREHFDMLTGREREVMALVVTGMLNKQIAGELGTTEKSHQGASGSGDAQDGGGLARGIGQDRGNHLVSRRGLTYPNGLSAIGPKAKRHRLKSNSQAGGARTTVGASQRHMQTFGPFHFNPAERTPLARGFVCSPHQKGLSPPQLSHRRARILAVEAGNHGGSLAGYPRPPRQREGPGS